jgi:3D (Asp-Asp-Asp) domain-containing protein
MNKLDNYYNRNGETDMSSNLNRFLIFAMCLLTINIVGSKKVLGYYKSKYDNMVAELKEENSSLKLRLKEYTEVGIPVKVTMYQPVVYQTDSTPNILADGTRIRIQKASEYKFIAVSRNLLKRWGGFLDFGDWILLRGTDHKDGVYQVRDVMNKRFVNRIDILEGTDVDPYMFPLAEIVKLSWSTTDETALTGQ